MHRQNTLYSTSACCFICVCLSVHFMGHYNGDVINRMSWATCYFFYLFIYIFLPQISPYEYNFVVVFYKFLSAHICQRHTHKTELLTHSQLLTALAPILVKSQSGTIHAELTRFLLPAFCQFKTSALRDLVLNKWDLNCWPCIVSEYFIQTITVQGICLLE